MKHTHNPNNAPNVVPESVPVRFEFTHPTATSVFVAGTFNHWQPEAKALHSAGGGHWFKETVLAPGTYEYCLIVDDQWMPDPKAKDSVANPFGGRNSVLTVVGAGVAGPSDATENASAKGGGKRQLSRHKA